MNSRKPLSYIAGFILLLCAAFLSGDGHSKYDIPALGIALVCGLYIKKTVK